MNLLRPFLCTSLTILMIACFASACDWTYPIWIPRTATADPVYQFMTGDKMGYIDRTGRILIAPERSILEGTTDGEFHDGLLEIGVDGGVYLDTAGKKVIHKKFYRGWSFSEGLAAAMEKDGGKWGYINTRGEFEISPRFASSQLDYVWPFQGGLAMIMVGGKFGYINHSGELVIRPSFLDGDSFHDGMSRVIVEGPCAYSRITGENPCPDFGVLPRDTNSQESLPSCKYSYIDTSGKVISGERYDYALPFAEGLAPVRIGKLWGYIDKQGTMAITPRFDSASSFSEGLGLVSAAGLFGYIDRTGSYVISPQFIHAESFADGRAVVGEIKSGEWYIDSSGKQAIPGKFAVASSFFKGLAHVKMLDSSGGTSNIHASTFAYIDVTGRVVFRYKS
jgi:WG containing repeat